MEPSANKKLNRPVFESEAEEARWWEQVNLSEYVETPISNHARQRKTPPSHRLLSYPPPVSIRFAPEQITDIKQLAELKGTNYQSLIKLWVAERLMLEKNKSNLSADVTAFIASLKTAIDKTVEEQIAAFSNLNSLKNPASK